MKILRALLALASLGPGILVSWSFFSGLPTGESSPFVYLMIPVMIVGVLPTLLGLLVCMAILMAQSVVSLFLRMTSPGALTRLGTETRGGHFVIGIISAAMGLVVSCLLASSKSGSYGGDWRAVLFTVSWLLMPAILGILACVVVMAAGHEEPRRRQDFG